MTASVHWIRSGVREGWQAVVFGFEGLTVRELEVLRLVAHGKTNREVAANLVVSPYTVKVHVAHILAKLAAQTRHDAARLFWERAEPPA